ncbi:uncharacterized protein LOC111888793 [Lactuca sativa]|uniref:uncharacterized protein LOC111888793 n=1 Tax=Lactuca sativa TaxID=4236 RepID=UPI000CD86A1A|nr:uncharacterized protein LOC111888793 [Lactuca sativa]
MFSKYGIRGETKWCNKYGRKHNGICPKEVICFKCGKTSHYAHKCSTKEVVCLKCSGDGHFKQDWLMRATTPNVPLKHYERCDEEVTCYKYGKTGHYAGKFTSKKRVCYECNKEGNLLRDCPKKNEAATANAPP